MPVISRFMRRLKQLNAWIDQRLAAPSADVSETPHQPCYNG